MVKRVAISENADPTTRRWEETFIGSRGLILPVLQQML